MSEQYSLFAKKETQSNKPVVSINQVIQMFGYNDPRYVVYKIEPMGSGYNYHLINIDNMSFQTTRRIRPLSEKFGIGIYFDETNPQFMSSEEVVELLTKVQIKERLEKTKIEEEKERMEKVRVIGRQWLKEHLPNDAQAIIVGRLKQDESDSQTDYFASSVQRTVILGFSKHKRDLFSEMRKFANNFEGTSYLAEYNAEYENREKYSMGAGYYLGNNKYDGWIIEKSPIYNRDYAIEEFAYIAGDSNNIHLATTKAVTKNVVVNAQFEIVDYSQKSIALFGDTKPIKDLLLVLGGRFNPRLTHNGEKKAGWVFQTTKREELEAIINLKSE